MVPTPVGAVVAVRCMFPLSLLTEGQGVPLGVAAGGAIVSDHKLIRATIESIPIERPKPSKKRPQHLCLDRGYDYAEARELAVASSPAGRNAPTPTSQCSTSPC